jgi:hypothetical protein
MILLTLNTVSSSLIIEPEDTVYMDDLEKRKKIYSKCGEYDEPDTGKSWCQPCNSKRFKKNFKNWSGGDKDIETLMN